MLRGFPFMNLRNEVFMALLGLDQPFSCHLEQIERSRDAVATLTAEVSGLLISHKHAFHLLDKITEHTCLVPSAPRPFYCLVCPCHYQRLFNIDRILPCASGFSHLEFVCGGCLVTAAKGMGRKLIYGSGYGNAPLHSNARWRHPAHTMPLAPQHLLPMLR
ncbi:uncharacterized protein BDW43DRAFT_233566 [Aspergillus alliaceus]|uniref:uncharacterized protein n=1 Tax=Petromyces alliaceus TaxID=209559 RepID=UPI0012A47FAB|nr:uncharacterized protein BDW43DRAFT_233566 [Aspergillus alliaceus]KAB8227966.1 hypothetical protein BDW43DRAFT_233566 [Aspergillus alliaceus]